MIEFDLPIEFIEKISRSFGDTGKVWLMDLPETIETCASQWQLSKLRVCNELSYNLILFAHHPTYGEVVLKIGVPHLDLFSEMEAIQLYGGRGICRCYAVDKAHGAMLLEKVSPGDDLRSVNDADHRYQITAGLYQQIHTSVPKECTLPTYQSLIERAIQRLPENPQVPQKLVTWLHLIRKEHKALIKETPQLVVLHCDLHHMNILRDGNDWKLIDPKGFIGVPAMECIRFMQNELGLYEQTDKKAAIEKMIACFAPALKVSTATVKKCFFIDSVLSCYWSHEERSPQDQLQECLTTCELAFEMQK